MVYDSKRFFTKLKKTSFLNFNLNIPHDSENYLKFCYGEVGGFPIKIGNFTKIQDLFSEKITLKKLIVLKKWIKNIGITIMPDGGPQIQAPLLYFV